MIFSERETIEYRLHTGTTSPTKMMAWCFICAAITRYAENNIKKIITSSEKISFKEVLNYYADHFPKNKTATELSEYLLAYYDTRCKTFAKDYEKSDFLSQHEINKDKEFSFVFNGKDSLF